MTPDQQGGMNDGGVERLGELPVVEFATADAWERWLEEHHDSTPNGVWIRFSKKDSGIPSITYVEAVEAALCFGWIDGQARSYDDRRWLQKFTPRRKRSIWSKINRTRAEALIESGRMRPAGMAAVDAAKADGRWDAAYEGPATATVPDDLERALDASPVARSAFDALNSTNRYAILFRVQGAKRPETRARRIDRFVAMLERGEKLYP